MIDFVDIDGKPLCIGDNVIVARPAGGYRSTGAKLDRGTVDKFTDSGVTLVKYNEDGSVKDRFNTPYRANKFMKVEND